MSDGVLTDDRRRLVGENLGLVSTHLRRHVPGLDRPRREREWDDLYQEGCVGLIRAAAAHDPAGGIPFPAYALRRIQSAVNRALERSFSTVHVPDGERVLSKATGERIRGVVTLDVEPPVRRSDRVHDPFDQPSRETIGTQLRGKYERAVREAERVVSRVGRVRGDYAALLRRIVEQRLLIPDETHRPSLRQVARETRSSYARVVNAEKRLVEQIQSIMAADRELPGLRSAARTGSRGWSTPADSVVGEYAGVRRADFRRLWKAASSEIRGRMLATLVVAYGWDTRRCAVALFERLDAERRRRIVYRFGGLMSPHGGDSDADRASTVRNQSKSRLAGDF